MSTPTADPLEANLKYEPAPEIPASFTKEFLRICEINPLNNLPWLRFTWGMDATEQIGEYIVHRYPDPDNIYVGTRNWVLEGWQDPSVYDEAQWRAEESVLGPFPERGVWDYIAIVPRFEDRPILGSHALGMAREWRHWRSKTKARVLDDLVKQRCALQRLKEVRWDEKKEEILDTFVRDYSNIERGQGDRRKFTTVAKIDGFGHFEKTEAGLLVPSLG